VNDYISALLDFRSKFDNNSVRIDCKHEKIAGKVSKIVGGTVDGVVITIKNVDEFYGAYSPYIKYDEYRKICLKKLLFPRLKQEPSHEYMAAIFDLTGALKVNMKGDSAYANATFRNKSALEVLSHFYKKSASSQFYMSGEELLWALEHLKEFLIIKGDQAEVLCNCISNPDDPDNWADWLATQKGE